MSGHTSFKRIATSFKLLGASISVYWITMTRRCIAALLCPLFLLGCGKPSPKEAAENFKIGYIYERGIGVAKDATEAFKWYRKAADAGLAEAQYNLGVLYYNGTGVARSAAEAARWFELAANQNLSEAQFNIGNAYRIGEGVTRNYASALSWYRKAALLGYAPAQFNLAAMHENGEGTTQNYAEAYKWLRLAEMFGYTPATKYLKNFAHDLRPGEREKALQAAEELFLSIPKPVVPQLLTGSVLQGITENR